MPPILPALAPKRGDTDIGTLQPHRALELRPPEPDERREELSEGDIRRRDRLGGIIHEYYRAAA
jgi:hypothetical protein